MKLASPLCLKRRQAFRSFSPPPCGSPLFDDLPVAVQPVPLLHAVELVVHEVRALLEMARDAVEMARDAVEMARDAVGG